MDGLAILLLLGGGLWLLSKREKESEIIIPPSDIALPTPDMKTGSTPPAPEPSLLEDMVYVPPEAMIQPVPAQPALELPPPEPETELVGGPLTVQSTGVGTQTYSEQWGTNIEDFPKYPAQQIEAGITTEKAEVINQYVRDGLWDRSILEHAAYWIPLNWQRTLGIRNDVAWMTWFGTPEERMEMFYRTTGFRTYAEWESNFLSTLYAGL